MHRKVPILSAQLLLKISKPSLAYFRGGGGGGAQLAAGSSQHTIYSSQFIIYISAFMASLVANDDRSTIIDTV